MTNASIPVTSYPAGATDSQQQTKWWKCDLQVATPAWDFKLPAGESYDFTSSADRIRFADGYMTSLKAKGVEVIALADHNCHEWIDDMRAAGERQGVVVFPGCEVTTGSGADGVHLIIVGDPSCTADDFNQLLAGPLGFDHQHPRFHGDAASKQPGSSGKTLCKILDDLPRDYLVIAPHAFNDNGIASGNTAKGDIRWKALHHERLSAVDPGNCSDPSGDSFNDQFRRRELNQFPCLDHLAFVSTSDAYTLDDLGCRYSWIRMANPTIEALRQAFIDHEARILCDWDSRLKPFPNHNPNDVRHGWIPSIKLGPGLGNSNHELEVPLAPGLNTIIGGRGSGKSTVVAVLRQLYSTTAHLPPTVKQEAEAFAQAVLDGAELSAEHRLPDSQQLQSVRWTKSAGSQTTAEDGTTVDTTFRVRVVNQKELFERVAKSKDDPFAASRSFLAFVDESLGFEHIDDAPPDSWRRRFEDACNAWSNKMRMHQTLLQDLAQLPREEARLRELNEQLEAFDSEDAQARRQNIKQREEERAYLAEDIEDFETWVEELIEDASEPSPTETQEDSTSETQDEESQFDAGFIALQEDLYGIIKKYEQRLRDMQEQARNELEAVEQRRLDSPWWKAVKEAEDDAEAYRKELEQKGIDPEAYTQIQQSLKHQKGVVSKLKQKQKKRKPTEDAVTKAWETVIKLLNERLSARSNLLEDVSARSGTLRFSVQSHADITGWTDSVRELLNLRSDSFLDDVPALGQWLWHESADDQTDRWQAWRDGLAKGDLGDLQDVTLRANWRKKLEDLDEALRLRLAHEIADDVVTMRFLRDGGNRKNKDDWQVITEGSPGQRTAAMLGFVLHHGREPLVIDQPEDDLDTEWISSLVVKELRASRWKRQLIVITHNANIPVNGDADQVVVLENMDQSIRIRQTSEDGHPLHHCGPIEVAEVRRDVQNIMEGGIAAFIRREQKYSNEMRSLTVTAE